jgi:hypothetical protein
VRRTKGSRAKAARAERGEAAGAAVQAPFRIGILSDGDSLAAWQVECIRKIRELPFAQIVVLIVNSPPAAPRAPFAVRLRRKIASGLLLWRIYERLILDRKVRANEPTRLQGGLESLPRIECTPINIGKFRQSFDLPSLEALKSLDLDVLLRFGFGILSGEILSLPRYGIWSFHHGDPQYFRGAPPGFWEIHNREPVTGVILQRLTEKLDGGVVLHSGWFKTMPSNYARSLDRILFGAAHFVARALVELRRDPQRLRDAPALARCGRVYSYPRTRAVVTFLARSTAAWLADQYRSMFRHQQWTLGMVERPITEVFQEAVGTVAQIRDVTWLPETKGRFLADPFPALGEGSSNSSIILAEEFDWAAERGQISAIEWSGKRSKGPVRAIQTDAHLSYPYTFNDGGEIYCAPECAESNAVTLYRLDRGNWVRHKVIIEGFPAIDPTIFRHEGRWWLFCTSAEAGANEFLFSWYADRLDGEWAPHPANPLKVDIRSARPAGRPFLAGHELIRPAQDCSRLYGGAISFNRIIKLSTEEFVEESVGNLVPDPARYPAGLHTICGAGEVTIVDGARWAFVATEFWRTLRRKFERGR